MSDAPNPGSLNTLLQLKSATEQLDKVMFQLLRYLTSQGITLSTDIAGIMRELRDQVKRVEQSSHRATIQVEQLRGLIETAGLINSALELEVVLEGVMDTIIRLTGAERAFVVLQEAGTGELKPRAARNWDQEKVMTNDLVFSRSIIKSVLSDQQPVVTINAQTDERFQAARSIQDKAMRSVMCVPMLLRGETIGVIYADNRILPGIFDDDTLSIVKAFANLAAVAIDNARFVAQMQADLESSRRQLERLQVQIDHTQKERQVGEVTQSDYFQKLQSMARQLRSEHPEE